MKPTVVCDTECYVDYFLAMFRRVDTGKTVAFELYEGQELDVKMIRRIMQTCRVVTFNGINYDVPMLTYAVCGATNVQLKTASDAIIGGNLRPWHFERQFNVKIPNNIDHIDISEVAPGVMISLKQYAARMHMPRLQDLPLDPSASITPELRPILRDYCGNSDLPATQELWERLTKEKNDVIAIRERIGKEIGIDVRSKSDAQVAESVLKTLVERHTKEKLYKPEVPPGTTFKYNPPAFLQFRTKQLQDVLAVIASAQFVVRADGKINEPEEIKDRVVTMGTSCYTIGIGGLHSCEKSIAHFADEETVLIDRDVASFYPFLIKMCALYPRNIGPLFLNIYGDWLDRRIAAKGKDKALAQMLKIFLNGLYGKLGSPYSIVFAPDLLIQVTLTGQLVLLMLIERLESAGASVVSANTDGIVIKCRRDMKNVVDDIVAQWEKDTGLETEETFYSALFSRDINNYVALKEDGGYKSKGVFADPSLMKNVENEICIEAVTKFLEFGVSPERTIRACTDVRKFLTMRKVKGGAVLIQDTAYDDSLTPSRKRDVLLANGWHQIETGPLTKAQFDHEFINLEGPCDVETAYRRHCGEDKTVYLGKVVRWYIGMTNAAIYYKEKNKSGGRNKVAGSTGAVPMMTLVESMPYDINYQAYIAEAEDILKSIGVTPVLRASMQFPCEDLFY